ncbi:uncharacterized protein LOC143443157 [Arvicanthis niloticus]|uniref:uncharacterized protein LOC143313376 n=1 Tax=Arvicanthis niloticus TaxID=61156 RepID=UPI00402BE950
MCCILSAVWRPRMMGLASSNLEKTLPSLHQAVTSENCESFHYLRSGGNLQLEKVSKEAQLWDFRSLPEEITTVSPNVSFPSGAAVEDHFLPATEPAFLLEAQRRLCRGRRTLNLLPRSSEEQDRNRKQTFFMGWAQISEPPNSPLETEPHCSKPTFI